MALLSLTLFGSAALLFLVQPLLAKWLLPLFGSTPAVWTTSLLFFQLALLAGYLYAHLLGTRLELRRALLVHVGLVLLALVTLPVGVPAGAAPAPGESPALPSSSSSSRPWGCPSSRSRPRRPCSSAGSRPPTIPPPATRTCSTGRATWAASRGSSPTPSRLSPASPFPPGDRLDAGYVGVAGLVAGSALALRRAPRGGEPAEPAGAAPAAGARPGPWRRARWVALAFVPSSLVLGVTAFLTRTSRPCPCCGSCRSALYLLTFVAAFSPGPAGTTIARAGALALPPLALLLAAVLATEPGWPLWVLLLVHLGAFTAVAMSCHGALAADRPPPRHLTAFYGWVALGGALGGAFNAVVAPLAFDAHLEYPLALLLGCLLWPGLPRLRGWDRRLAVAAPALVAMGVAGVLVGGAVERASSAEPVLVRERNFFGVHRVEAGASARAPPPERHHAARRAGPGTVAADDLLPPQEPDRPAGGAKSAAAGRGGWR